VNPPSAAAPWIDGGLALPEHRGAEGAPVFELGTERIHELELQSELNRHAIPVR